MIVEHRRDWLLIDVDGITVLGVGDGLAIEGVDVIITRTGRAKYLVSVMQVLTFETIANVSAEHHDSMHVTLDLVIEQSPGGSSPLDAGTL